MPRPTRLTSVESPPISPIIPRQESPARPRSILSYRTYVPVFPPSRFGKGGWGVRLSCPSSISTSTPSTACWTAASGSRPWPRRPSVWASTALALTDHGAVYGAVPFVKAMRAAGLKPILGAELYVVDEYGPPPRPGEPYHLPVLAATEEGYVHLLELVTCGQLDHFHKKPLLTLAEIAPRAGGLIALSGCLRGAIGPTGCSGGRAGARSAWRPTRRSSAATASSSNSSVTACPRRTRSTGS